jgi:hypothetical protein
MKKRWTKKEIYYLKKHYNEYGASFCAKHLNINNRRVRIKASRLGIINKIKNSKTKVCKGCWKIKSLNDFSPHRIAKFGKQSKCKQCRAKWESLRKKTDKTYRLIHSIRNRIRIAIKKNVKSSSSFNLLGCDINFLKQYLASQFKQDMSWDNYGKWHIDHIKPCHLFNLSIPEEQQKCFHYSNLQPLWAKDNLSKGKSVKYNR